LRRSIGDLLQSPLERVAVAGCQNISQAAGEIERVRRQLRIWFAPPPSATETIPAYRHG
jgi:hypothetical protein